jgi:hypothetical protein
MKFTVTSDRMSFPRGTVVDANDLVGGNIAVLVATGHLTSAPSPSAKTKWKPEPPVTVEDSADEPEEQE